MKMKATFCGFFYVKIIVKHYEFPLFFVIIYIGDFMIDLLENLNEKQREAVLQTEGPVMAIAGAGSGKTSVLTRRIAYLVFEKKIHFQNILAITFTNKAAKEMKERVHGITGLPTRQMWISTFHAMCSKILRDHIELLGYKRSFQIIDDDDVVQLIKSIMKKKNIDIKLFKPKIVKYHVLKMKFDKSHIEDVEAPLNLVVNSVFKTYEKNLSDNNLVDFEGLLILTIQLLKENEEIRTFYQNQFKYILVDEFQDTNNVQYELIKLLVGDNRNLFIVGDEDQSIYAFRGANIENINKFKREYPDYHLVLLEQNYRSTNTILQAANQIIKNNSVRVPKNLFSTKGKGAIITQYKGITARDEVEYIAMKIIKLMRGSYSYNDFAVLYRANNTSRMFEDVFLQKQVPYRVVGNTSFFKRREIKDFVAYLRLILNMNDAFSFMRVISAPRRGIGQVTVDKLVTFAAEYDLNLLEAIDRSDEILGKSAVSKLVTFKSMILDFRKQLDELPFSSFVDYILLNSGYIEMLKKDEKGDVRYENLLEFKTILSENQKIYEDLDKEEILLFLLEDISLKSEEGKNDLDDAVTFMTLHAAKGLEFRVVFIVTLENGMFPLNRSMSNRKDFEEERRLMYVGVTRAKEKLFLTNANTRQTYGEMNQNPDSVFLKEIDSDLMEVKGYNEIISKPLSENGFLKRKTSNAVKRKSISNYNKNELNKGDKVTHGKFGNGVVVSVAGDNCIIAFSHPHGIKKLLKDHPSIQKI